MLVVNKLAEIILASRSQFIDYILQYCTEENGVMLNCKGGTCFGRWKIIQLMKAFESFVDLHRWLLRNTALQRWESICWHDLKPVLETEAKGMLTG